MLNEWYKRRKYLNGVQDSQEGFWEWIGEGNSVNRQLKGRSNCFNSS